MKKGRETSDISEHIQVKYSKEKNSSQPARNNLTTFCNHNALKEKAIYGIMYIDEGNFIK